MRSKSVAWTVRIGLMILLLLAAAAGAWAGISGVVVEGRGELKNGELEYSLRVRESAVVVGGMTFLVQFEEGLVFSDLQKAKKLEQAIFVQEQEKNVVKIGFITLNGVQGGDDLFSLRFKVGDGGKGGRGGVAVRKCSASDLSGNMLEVTVR